MGRERPRPRVANVAQTPFGGVAHVPHAGVADVLGRASDLREMALEDGGSFPKGYERK
jgi:hypothetical protein